MKIRYGIAMLALAVACITAVPALAADGVDSSKTNGPADFCQRAGPGFGGFDGFGDWMLLVDDATRENFENMTLAEIKDLKEQKTQELENMTLAEIKDLKEQRALEGQERFDNMTLGEIRELRNSTCPMNACIMGQDGMGPMGSDGMNQGRMLKVRMGQGMDGNSGGFGPADGQNGYGQDMQAGKAVGGDN